MAWSEDDLKRLMEKKGKPPGKTTSKQRMQALGRLKEGKQNKTELSYEQHLEWRKHIGEVAWFKFEGVKLRLADATFYTCDYFVMLTNGELEAHEVKGFWTDDARVKIKVAAGMYPFRFIAVKAKAKSEGGGWEFEDFSRT